MGKDLRMRVLLMGLLLVFGLTTSASALEITQDIGGRIGTYIEKYASVATSNETVRIDGPCLSACTIALGLRLSQLCVTPKAVLGFHAAYDMYASLDNPNKSVQVTNHEATDLLLSTYPTAVKRWIQTHGGLTRKMIYLRGKQLEAIIPRCADQSNTFAHSLY